MKFGVCRVALGILTSSLCLSVYSLFYAPTGTRARAATPQQLTPIKTNTHTGGGLRTTTFDTPHGRVVVHLPDDMRAGDTVSGTAVAEPKGATEEERGRSSDALKNFVVEIEGTRASPRDGMFELSIPNRETSAGDAGRGLDIILKDPQGVGVSRALGQLRNMSPLEGAPRPAGNFSLPAIGQHGRPAEILGPFDGGSGNTTLTLNGQPAKVLAESPRKAVFESPTSVTGPSEIVIKEGGVETKGTYRNLGVRLSAPKTNLLRGERTTLTIEVSGLQGIKEDAPLQLDARGVVQMEGGNFQNLRIRPQEVKADGRYTTTRAVTGQQAGSFTVTATVIVRPFDVCLQDDSNPSAVMMWNTFNGKYYVMGVTHRGMSPAGQTPTAGAGQVKPADSPTPAPPGGLSLTGTGKVAMKGCIITLSHNAPDRRVFARLDTCGRSGDFRMQASTPQQLGFTDSNTADSVCPAPGKPK